jgi:periplasmic divalent cation tolerance protein
VNTKARFQVVLVTAPLLPVARKLTEQILRARLAACVNLLPAVESHYWWEGKLEKSGEVLLLIKTTANHLKALRRLVKRNHPYTTPEFIALPVASGSKKYLKWLEAAVA